MKIGISAFAWTGQFELKHLPLLTEAKQMGIDGFEIPLFDPAQPPAVEIRRAMEENGLECTVCAILPAGVNPISPEAAERSKALQHLSATIETAAECGAKLIAGPLFAPIGYLPPHRPTSDEWNWAVEFFQQVSPVAAAHGITLAVEPVNRSETFFLRTAGDALRLCQAVAHPSLGVTIDTFHANIEEKSIDGAIRTLGPHLKHLHASESDRSLLGGGHMNFPTIIAALKEIQYQSFLMIEGFGFAEEEKNAPGYLWAEVQVAPKDIAVQGKNYLGALMG